jgi:hypothetical protein
MSVQHQTSSEHQVDLFEVATEMRGAGLPDQFIADAVAVAREYEGVYDLMMMWVEAVDHEDERADLVADIQDMIDECAEPVGPRKERYVRFDDLDWIADHIMTFKDNLRRVVDKQGLTLTELSERTGMPVPSLSRFFNSASMPRRNTLLKFAEALDLSAVEIATDWDY